MLFKKEISHSTGNGKYDGIVLQLAPCQLSNLLSHWLAYLKTACKELGLAGLNDCGRQKHSNSRQRTFRYESCSTEKERNEITRAKRRER